MLVGNLRQKNKMINKILMTSSLAICILLFAASTSGQSKAHSSKGFLILSDGYEKYLDTLKKTDVIDFPFIPNVFIPTKQFEKGESLVKRNFRSENLIRGFAVEFPALDSLAKFSERHINNLINQKCYNDSLFYIVAVEIEYVFIDRTKHPLVCDDPIQLGFDGRKVIFSFTNPEIRIISLRRL
jgi:hypothetical protein